MAGRFLDCGVRSSIVNGGDDALGLLLADGLETALSEAGRFLDCGVRSFIVNCGNGGAIDLNTSASERRDAVDGPTCAFSW